MRNEDAMNVGPAEIERLVRDALSRLAGAAPHSPTGDSSSRPTTAADDALELTTAVVTLAEIDGRLGGKRRLIVNPKAIVTPAVRDALRQSKIALERRTLDNPKTPSATKAGLTVAVAARFDAGRTIDRLRRDGYFVQQLAQSGLSAAVRELAEEVARGGARGLLFADEAEAAVVALNRRSGVRAVGGDDPRTVSRASSAVAANALVVRPANMGEFVLHRLVAAWLNARPAVSDDLQILLT